jgi:2,3-bisphosphoglycerate-dependent phosphoglycerate mutase
VHTVLVLVRHAASAVPTADGPGTFVARALVGFGTPVDWPFHRDMPMPAVYRVAVARDGRVTVPGTGR